MIGFALKFGDVCSVIAHHVVDICAVELSTVEFRQPVHRGLILCVQSCRQRYVLLRRDTLQLVVRFTVVVYHTLPKVLYSIV